VILLFQLATEWFSRTVVVQIYFRLTITQEFASIISIYTTVYISNIMRVSSDI
jgi:hypothetical protein